MDQRYPEIGRRRRFLEVIHGRLMTGGVESLLLKRPDVREIGAALGLDEHQSVILVKSLADEGYLRTHINNSGRRYLQTDQSGLRAIYVEGITDKGLRLIGVLPTVDSVEGIVASLEELAEQIRESRILSPEDKDHQIRALRTLMGDLRQAGVGIGAEALLQYIARGLIG